MCARWQFEQDLRAFFRGRDFPNALDVIGFGSCVLEALKTDSAILNSAFAREDEATVFAKWLYAKVDNVLSVILFLLKTC